MTSNIVNLNDHPQSERPPRTLRSIFLEIVIAVIGIGLVIGILIFVLSSMNKPYTICNDQNWTGNINLSGYGNMTCEHFRTVNYSNGISWYFGSNRT